MTPADDPAGAPPRAAPRYPWRSTPTPVRQARSRAGELQGRRAGLVTRFLANALDAGVVLLALGAGYSAVAIGRFLLHPTGFQLPAPAFGLVVVLGGVLQAGYFAVAWATAGRSYGDEVLGLRVVSSRGQRIRWTTAVVRAVLCVLFPIGLLWVLVSPRNRSLQAVVLQTSVVYDWPGSSR